MLIDKILIFRHKLQVDFSLQTMFFDQESVTLVQHAFRKTINKTLPHENNIRRRSEQFITTNHWVRVGLVDH